jgi:hypothetical protein
MAYEHAIRRYRHWYAKLLRLYSKPYYERFGESMEQTFTDLLRERAEEERKLFGYALGMFVETSEGIIRENMTFIIKQNITKRLSVWAAVVALLLMVPLVAMQFTDEVAWNHTDFIVAGVLLFGSSLAYELVARKGDTITYRAAVGLALVAALFLVWMNLAVGSEDDSPGLMFFGVLVVGIIGAITARFRPHGMARALFATALAQALVAVIAMIAWEQYFEILILNGFFIALWVGSALLFRRAARTQPV